MAQVTITFSVPAAEMHNALEEICDDEEKAGRYRIVYPNRSHNGSPQAELENAQFEYLEILYPTEQYGNMIGSSAATQSGKAKLLLMMLYSKMTVVGFRPIAKGQSEIQYLCIAMAENSLLQNRYHLVPTFEPLDVKTFGLTHVLDQSFKLSLLAFHCTRCDPPIDFRNSNYFPQDAQGLLKDAKKYTIAQLGFIGGFGYNPRPLQSNERRLCTIKDDRPDVYAHILATWELLLSPRYAEYNPEEISVAGMKTYCTKVGWYGKRQSAALGVYSERGVRERMYFQENGVNGSGLARLYQDESMVAGSEDRLDTHILRSLVFLGYYDLWDCLSSTFRQKTAHRAGPPKERTTKSNRYVTPEEANELFRPHGNPQRKWLLHANPFHQFAPYSWNVPFDYEKKFQGEGARGERP